MEEYIRSLDYNPKEYVDIVEYTKRGMFWKVLELIDKGCDINEKNPYGVSALSVAIERRNITIIKILLGNGASVDNIMLHNCPPDIIALIDSYKRPTVTKRAKSVIYDK